MTFRSFRRPTADTLDDTELVPSPTRLEPGSRLGRYVIERVIGAGGSSTVFLVRHVVLDARYAAKVLHGDVEPDILARGRNEASITQRIAHRHIVKVLDEGQLPDGAVFVVMEYLEGEDLASRLWRQRLVLPNGRPWLPAPELRHWGSQLISGLTAAHEAGVIHRDLKPENAFLSVSEEGLAELKILDFGLARARGFNRPDKRITDIGQVFGTPHYMAPEQARSSRDADERSDIYSFGVLLYEMATAAMPFDGDTPMDVLLAHATKKPADPRSLNPYLPDALADLILRCMAREPERRPASMREVGEAFAQAWPYAQEVRVASNLAERMQQWMRESTTVMTAWLETMSEGLTPPPQLKES